MRRAALALLIGVCAGCGTIASAAPTDAGRTDTGRVDRPATDTGPARAEDQDGDGVCDATEAMAGTDPARGDTDGDGLTDRYELRFGTDPLNSREPDAVDRVQLREAPSEVVLADFSVLVNAQGGVVAGLWQDRGLGVDDRLASAWVTFDLPAVAANPAGVVQEISGSRFVGVLGRTQLAWRLTTRSRGGAADGDGAVVRLGCRRAYEFVLVAQEDGGEALRSRRMTLDVLPAQGGSGTWEGVDGEGFCQARECE